MDELTDKEKEIIVEVLRSHALQNLIGAEEWGLSEEDEEVLWGIIRRLG